MRLQPLQGQKLARSPAAAPRIVAMAEPANDASAVVAEAVVEKPAAVEAAAAKAEPAAAVAPGGISAAMEHMKAAAAALIPGGAGAQAEVAEPGVADKLKEAKGIAEAAAGDVKGAMGKISGLFAK